MVGCILFVAGARARQWVWVQTEEIRFYPNINNAYFWGMRVNHDSQTASDAFAQKRSSWREFFLGYQRIYQREWEAPSLRAMMVLGVGSPEPAGDDGAGLSADAAIDRGPLGTLRARPPGRRRIRRENARQLLRRPAQRRLAVGGCIEDSGV
jgi:hypothetical protein